MADSLLLGLFHEATPTANTIEQLRELGVAENRIAVLSGTPYKPEMLGRDPHYERLVPIALIGAASGLIAALFLTVGTPLLYPYWVGGQELVPIPPTIIICFEFTMLGAMVATFAGLVGEITFPVFGSHAYDPRITEGHIGVLVRVKQDMAVEVENILTANGAHHLQRIEGEQRLFERRGTRWQEIRANFSPTGRYWLRWVLLLVVLAVPTAIGMLLAYSFFSIPIPNQMVDQVSVGYEMGPRLAAPEGAVPIEGPVLIAGQPATEPLPATSQSVQRGQALFNRTCAICHGESAQGNGKLAAFFNPQPANLTSPAIQKLASGDIFLVITNGFAQMPSLKENFSVADRWDVINYVRTVKQ